MTPPSFNPLDYACPLPECNAAKGQPCVEQWRTIEPGFIELYHKVRVNEAFARGMAAHSMRMFPFGAQLAISDLGERAHR